MSPVDQHRNDAEYTITGRVLDDNGTTITLVRKAPDLTVRRVLGEKDGWVSIVDHWHEAPPEPTNQPLCMTLVHSPLEGGRYGVVVWYHDQEIAEALRGLNLRDTLAVTVYGIGTLDPGVRKRDQARACGLELARMVTDGYLPWPPEDDADIKVWLSTTAVIDRRHAAA